MFLLDYLAFLSTNFQQAYQTESAHTPWYHDPLWLGVILTSILVILGIITICILIKRREPKEQRMGAFPFEIIDPSNLAGYLEKKQLLTETKNTYFSRLKNQTNQPIDIPTSERKILIVGPASIGKTREALRLIKKELTTGSDPCSILIPLTGTIPEDFSSEQIPQELVGRSVILMYDDLPNIFASTEREKKLRLATPQERVENIIHCFKTKTNQCHFIATARSELLYKLENFDYRNDAFWKYFEIYKLCDLTKENEREMIDDLINLYEIQIEQKAIERMQEINMGASCESLVTFLKQRANKKIELKEVNEIFREDAAESWKKSTFEPLKKQMPEIEIIYKVFKFIRFQLQVKIFVSFVLILTDDFFKKSTEKIIFSPKRKILSLLEFLRTRNCIAFSGKLVELPDYQLEKIPGLDFENQLSILRRKRKKMNNTERSMIAESLFNMGFLEAQQENVEDSLKKFEQSLTFRPKMAMAYFGIGTVYSMQRKYDDAIQIYNKAIQINSKFILTYLNRGRTYREMNNFDDAITDFNKVIEIVPDGPLAYQAYIDRGIAYDKKGELDKAIEDFTKAIEIDPDHPQAYTDRGIAYDKKGELDKAIEDFTKVIEIVPNAEDIYFNRGNAYIRKGEHNKAIENYTEALEINPKHAKALINRGRCYLGKHDEGDIDRAIGDLNSAIEIGPKLANAFFNRGMAYLLRNEGDEALKDFMTVIEIDPHFTMAMESIAQIYKEKGDTPNVKYWAEKAQKRKEDLSDK